MKTQRLQRPKPHMRGNTLVIPMSCESKYHWWKDGSMSIEDIRKEFGFPRERKWYEKPVGSLA